MLAVTIMPPFEERANAVTLRSISLASRTPTTLNSTLNDGATAWIALKMSRPYGKIPKHRHPRHARCDLFEQLQPLRAEAEFKVVKPVTFPPGRAKLSTMPAPTGSPTFANTMGTVRVACCSA